MYMITLWSICILLNKPSLITLKNKDQIQDSAFGHFYTLTHTSMLIVANLANIK